MSSGSLSNVNNLSNYASSLPTERPTTEQPLYNDALGRTKLVGQGVANVFRGIGLMASSIPQKVLNMEEQANDSVALGLNKLATGIFQVKEISSFSHNLIGSSINSPADLSNPFPKEEFERKLHELDQKLSWPDHYKHLKPPSQFLWQEGICAGIVVDFLSHYLNLMDKVPNLSERLMVLSKKYENGANQQAVFSQYVEHASYKAGVSVSNNFEALAATVSNLKYLYDKNLKFTENNGLKLYQQFETVPDGLYHISLVGTTSKLIETLTGDRKAGHAIVYHKSKDGSFIFDPNYGALFISKDSQKQEWKNFLESYEIICHFDDALLVPVDTNFVCKGL